METQKVFVFGIDQAGKTAFVLSMKEDRTVSTTLPTLAFNIDKISVQNMQFQIWDAPGQRAFREIWTKGYDKAKLLVFLLDVADTARYEEAFTEFTRVLEDPITRGIPLVFCYHKMDLPESKENLAMARKMFNLPGLTGRRMLAYETSIHDMKNLRKIRETFVEIVLGIMW
jgi:small GTP-binding protein